MNSSCGHRGWWVNANTLMPNTTAARGQGRHEHCQSHHAMRLPPLPAFLLDHVQVKGMGCAFDHTVACRTKRLSAENCGSLVLRIQDARGVNVQTQVTHHDGWAGMEQTSRAQWRERDELASERHVRTR